MQVKDCPCCGSDDVYIGVIAFDKFGVYCKVCKLEMSKYIQVGVKGTIEEIAQKTLEESIIAWNCRTCER
jgi:hypothetical protein